MSTIIQTAIGAMIGCIFGVIFGVIIASPNGTLSIDTLHAKNILVSGKLGSVSINGSHGISLYRDDYAAAHLWFHEPGTGDPGTGGPVLWIAGLEHQTFKASPSGQEVVVFPRDDKNRE